MGITKKCLTTLKIYLNTKNILLLLIGKHIISIKYGGTRNEALNRISYIILFQVKPLFYFYEKHKMMCL